MQNSMWNQNQTHGMLNVLPCAVDVKTSVRSAPPIVCGRSENARMCNRPMPSWKAKGGEEWVLLLRIVATIVKPTSEKIPPRAIFLRKLIRIPHRSHTGKPMTLYVYVSSSHTMRGILPELCFDDGHVGTGGNACKEGKIRALGVKHHKSEAGSGYALTQCVCNYIQGH